VARNGTLLRVGSLRPGDCFGEMSLLTGEPRTATVQAEHDCEVLEIAKPVMAEILRNSPRCLEQLSVLLAERKMETEGIVSNAISGGRDTGKQNEYRATFLSRLRTFFEL
jgi:CRP-like cAMP-binding protein